MIEVKTRKLTVKDFQKICRLKMLNDNPEENILDYLKISEDGEYLIYCKREHIDKNNKKGTFVASWVYEFKKNFYYPDVIYVCNSRFFGDECTNDYVKVRDVVHDGMHFIIK